MSNKDLFSLFLDFHESLTLAMLQSGLNTLHLVFGTGMIWGGAPPEMPTHWFLLMTYRSSRNRVQIDEYHHPAPKFCNRTVEYAATSARNQHRNP
jgi:hypothetical protein